MGLLVMCRDCGYVDDCPEFRYFTDLAHGQHLHELPLLWDFQKAIPHVCPPNCQGVVYLHYGTVNKGL